jgi:hypothetical protein
MGVKKRRVVRGGKNIIFRRGRGINIVFGPKYRPLPLDVETLDMETLDMETCKHGDVDTW